MEMLMNACDASATRVEFQTKTDKEGRLLNLTVRDNGRGFDPDRAAEVFGILGLPHTEAEDSTRNTLFGQFRMGRGQMLQYGVVTWLSGNHRFDVDVQQYGLQFQHTLAKAPTLGCSVSLDLYAGHNLRTDAIKAEVETAGHYLDMAVLWDGEPMAIAAPAHSPEDWTITTPDFYFQQNGKHSLEVYNQGVYVGRTYCQGLSGVFVSRTPLAVNMSRNAWLTDTCPVFKKLRKAANAHFAVTLDKAKLCLSEVRTASDLRLQLTLIRQAWEQLMHSKLTKEQRGTIRDVLAKAPCIPLLDGIIVSPDQLMTRVAGSSFHAHAPYSDSACLFVVTDTRGGHKSERTLAEQVYASGFVLPIDGQALLDAGILDAQSGARRDAYDMLCSQVVRLSGTAAGKRTCVCIDSDRLRAIAQEEQEGKRLIPRTELLPEFTQWLQLLEYMRYRTNRSLPYAADYDHQLVPHMALRIGHTDDGNVQAWTDGKTFVAFNQKFVREHGALWDPHIWMAVWLVYVHELAHAKRGGEGHDLAFYQVFHDLALKRVAHGYDPITAQDRALKWWARDDFPALPARLQPATKRKLKALAVKKVAV